MQLKIDVYFQTQIHIPPCDVLQELETTHLNTSMKAQKSLSTMLILRGEVLVIIKFSLRYKGRICTKT